MRRAWYFNESVGSSEAEPSESDLALATTHYNFEILRDLRMLDNHEYLSKSLTTGGIADAVKLLKVWLYQRQLSQVTATLLLK